MKLFLDKFEAEWYTSVWEILTTTDLVEIIQMIIEGLKSHRCIRLSAASVENPAWFPLSQLVTVPSFVTIASKLKVQIYHEEQMIEAPPQVLIAQRDSYLTQFVINAAVAAKSLFNQDLENKSSAVIVLNKKRKRVWDFKTNPKQTMTSQVSMPN